MRLRYFLKRLLLAIPTFLGITVFVYILATIAPGSPLDALLADPKISPAEIERKRAELGLDQNVIVQYWHWLNNFLQGNLGYSFTASKLPVAQLIGERLKHTLLLAVSSLFLSLLISIPIGIYAANKPNSLLDYIMTGFSFFAVGTPNFFIALIFIYIFSVQLKILPSGGMYDTVGAKTSGALIKHMILPVTVLSMQQIGSLIRYVRSSMLEVLENDYIRTAKAKGFNRSYQIRYHAFKNSLLPVVTMVGLMIPQLIGGAVITEQIFSWPGIGSLMVSSILSRDYPVIMGITVLISTVVLISNLITDIVYSMLDPRIDYR